MYLHNLTKGFEWACPVVTKTVTFSRGHVKSALRPAHKAKKFEWAWPVVMTTVAFLQGGPGGT